MAEQPYLPLFVCPSRIHYVPTYLHYMRFKPYKPNIFCNDMILVTVIIIMPSYDGHHIIILHRHTTYVIFLKRRGLKDFKYDISASSTHQQCICSALSAHHQRIICALSVHQQRINSRSLGHHQRIIISSIVHYRCIISASLLCIHCWVEPSLLWSSLVKALSSRGNT